MIIVEDEKNYHFEDAPNKINPAVNLKKQTNLTRGIWKLLQGFGLQYYGVVRDWSAIFGSNGTYIVLHHFLDEAPIEELFGKESKYTYNRLPMGEGLFDFSENLKESGFSITVPEQAYIDALESELSGSYDWHLDSPCHKLMFVVKKASITLTVEVFGDDMPFPPYGVKKSIPWPSLHLKEEGIQVELFPIDPFITHSKKEPFKGEQMVIADSVPISLEQATDEAIARAFQENDVCVIPVSGGKDSSVVMQKSIRYKILHPHSRAQLFIVSADTGVDNPLMQAHVRRLKEAVDSLGLDIPFLIVEPKIQDSYMVTVFGRGYKTPSDPNHKWCVSRLKTIPGRLALQQFVRDGMIVCQLLGLRSSESVSRSESIERHYADEFYGNHVLEGIRTCAPIRNWTATDVVTYLVRNETPWAGYGNHHLINLYGSSMGGIAECPIGASIMSDNEAVRSCTGRAARMGCWSCTIVSDDISLRNLSIGDDGTGGDYPELEPYYRMRSYFKGSQDLRYCGMTGYKRDNHGLQRFEPGFGNLGLDLRTILLQKMLELGIPIKDEEVDEIFSQVAKRELSEGIPVSQRFRNTLRRFYTVEPLIMANVYDPIMNPTGRIDHRTPETIDAIDRVMAMIEAGEIIPYWMKEAQ
ncbi:phosphoadenosine phosphosulfate reductase family protein [Paenibacillus sp. WQ 127069]|uniref:Phosphoadenosine phosphosulfate reductase family protein n=1 Tax=Paenibacillus baimaensis TaxID=2982185 RepID=A0ABT2UFE3_9BACL|nr:phosphoadenosine phosphosulfate reductase family protein [Paenibacillus sp. WQ 127069]MCU6793327.1 phosphoadenosine phosphosulfate reductase family protein [Paenibacillus sp. WQ 127069]